MEDVVGGRQAVRAAHARAQLQRAAARRRQVRHQHAARGFALGAFTARGRQQLRGQRTLPPGQGGAHRLPCLARGPFLAGAQRRGVGADQVQHAVQQVVGRFAPARIAQVGFVHSPMAVAPQEIRQRLAEGAVRRQAPGPGGAIAARLAQPGQGVRFARRPLRQRHQVIALGRRHAGFAAGHQRRGQRMAFAGTGAFHPFQQFGQGAAARALQEEQVVGGGHGAELLQQARAQRRAVGRRRFIQPGPRPRELARQVGVGAAPQRPGPAQVAQHAQCVAPALRQAGRGHLDLGLRAAQQRVHGARGDAERIVADPLDHGGVQVDAAVEHCRQARARQRAVAAQFEAASQHALGHQAAAVPFQRGHGQRQHFAGIAARPVGRLRLQAGVGVARHGGDGPGLHDPEILAVVDPFQVIRGAGIVQGAGGVARQGGQRVHLRGRQDGLRCPRRRLLHQLCAAAGSGQGGAAFGADALAGQGPGQLTGIRVQVVFVTLGLAAHQGFAQAPVGVDHHAIEAAAERVAGEGDAGGRGGQQGHDHHGHGAFFGLQAETLAVGVRLRRPGRVPDVSHGVDGRRRAAHVQARQMDAGERCGARVFLGRRGAQRQGQVEPAALAQGLVQRLRQRVGHGLAGASREAGGRRQHEARRHRNPEERHARQLPALAARARDASLAGGGPVQDGRGGHAALPDGAAPCRNNESSASNSRRRLAPGRSSQRSSAPRCRNCSWCVSRSAGRSARN